MGGATGTGGGTGGTAVTDGVGGGAVAVTMACVVAARLLTPLVLCDEIGGVNGYRGGV